MGITSIGEIPVLLRRPCVMQVSKEQIHALSDEDLGLLASGMRAFLFDDNTIRMDWFWATALGFVKLRVATRDVVEALEILRLTGDI